MGNPVGYKDVLSNIDLNNLKDSGLYYLSTGITNGDAYSYLVVRSANGNIMQQLYSSNGRSVKSRISHNGKWSDWYQLDNFGYNSLAELSAGVAGSLGTASVKRDNIDSTIETGIYGHGSALFDGGNFGVLVVFRNITQKYVAQIDICSERNISYRFGFEYEGQIAWGGWRTHS